jgi:aminoglycoside 6'-N-acetyltransferase Ib
VTAADFEMLHEWLARPHVAQWWSPVPSLDELRDEYSPDAAGLSKYYIVMRDGQAVGFIQSYNAAESHADGWWLDEHDPGVYGIDQFLASASDLGQGIGTAMVAEFVRMLFEDAAVTRVQTDPAPANARAIRAYEKVGFRRAGEVETPDGTALLMYCERGSQET